MSFKPIAIPSCLFHYIPRAGPSRLPAVGRYASTSTNSEPFPPGSDAAESALLNAQPSSSDPKSSLGDEDLAVDDDPEPIRGASRGGFGGLGSNNAGGGGGGFGGARNIRGATGAEDRDRDRQVKPDHPGYKNWLKSVGALYKDPPVNGPNWLGKDIPYPSNPSFRPPPPLSNALKDLIYSEIYTGGTSSSSILDTLQRLRSSAPGSETSSSSSTDARSGTGRDSEEAELNKRINRVSAEFGISKKRIEAVLKLKEHERGMVERGEVMQTPFLQAMEQYLGVRPIRPKNMQTTSRSPVWENQERSARASHPSSNLEASEEEAHKAFIQGEKPGVDSSAFTKRDTIESTEGMERAVWEFREEGLGPEVSRPDGTKPVDVPYNRVYSAGEGVDYSRFTKREKEAKDVGQSRIRSDLIDRKEIVKTGGKSSVYHFEDAADMATEATLSRKAVGKRQGEYGPRSKKAKRNERKSNARAGKQ